MYSCAADLNLRLYFVALQPAVLEKRSKPKGPFAPFLDSLAYTYLASLRGRVGIELVMHGDDT